MDLMLLEILIAAVRRRKGLPAPPDLPEAEVRAWEARRRDQSSLALKALLAAVAGHALLAGGLWVLSVRRRSTAAGEASGLLESGLLIAGIALSVGACAWAARSKGRSGTWGLLGFAPIVGLLGVGRIQRGCARCGLRAGIEATRCASCGGPV